MALTVKMLQVEQRQTLRERVRSKEIWVIALLSLHLIQISLALVNALMLQEVLAEENQSGQEICYYYKSCIFLFGKLLLCYA